MTCARCPTPSLFSVALLVALALSLVLILEVTTGL